MRYFAYGSNMLVQRLALRIGVITPLGVGRIHGHKLAFHKRSRDGSGKCDLFQTGHTDDIVYGVLYEIDHDQRIVLDHYEGRGYARRSCEVGIDGQVQRAYAYAAEPDHVEPDLQPFTWYKALVLAGALEHALPHPYLQAIETISSVDDPDQDRHRRNLHVLRQAGYLDILDRLTTTGQGSSCEA